MRQSQPHENGKASTNGHAPGASGVAQTDAPPPDLAAFFKSRPGGPLKSQATGGDLRAERLVRQVRGEMDELRKSLEAVRAVPATMTELDLWAVAANPEGAAALPPALLVRALVAAYERERRAERQQAKLRQRLGSARAQVRELKQERAFLRGRMQTFDQVLGALHANLEDLRAQRDAMLLPGLERAALPGPGETP